MLHFALGLGIDLFSSGLQFWQRLGGLEDDLLRGVDNLFGLLPGLEFAPVGPSLRDYLFRSRFGLGDLGRNVFEASSGSGPSNPFDDINPTSFGSFGNEEVLLREFPTSKGNLELAAEVVIKGKKLELRNLSIFPVNTCRLKVGNRELIQLKNQLIEEARTAGFETLRITGRRISGASFDGTITSGRKIDIIIELTNKNQ